MKVRTHARITAVLVAATVLAACGSSGGSTSGASSTDLGGKTVTIAVENQYPPFNYVNKDTNKAEGWDYDTWRKICTIADCKPQFKVTGFEGMIQAVSDGQFDAAADGITITKARAKVVDFSAGVHQGRAAPDGEEGRDALHVARRVQEG